MDTKINQAAPERKYEIGHFANWSFVASGSGGKVYKCIDMAGDKRAVALKRISLTEASSKHGFATEVDIHQSLTHVNVIQLFGHFNDGPYGYLILEFGDSDLHNYIVLSEDGLDMDDVKAKGKQLLNALEFCHNNKIIHRDFKPDNVMVMANGIVKLTDFGMARDMSKRPDDKMTMGVATTSYRAPELIVVEGHYDYAIDIWSFGCTIAEMVKGHLMFLSDDEIEIFFEIVALLGSPKEKDYPKFLKTPVGETLLNNCNSPSTNLVTLVPRLDSNPKILTVLEAVFKYTERPTATQLLDFDFFK